MFPIVATNSRDSPAIGLMIAIANYETPKLVKLSVPKFTTSK